MKLSQLHKPILDESWRDIAAGAAFALGGLSAYGQDKEPVPIQSKIEDPKAITGLATYYTCASCQREGTSGILTANGEKFNESALTCAMRRRDWGTQFKVTNLENGKSITVRLNDFGPGRKPTARGVVIDLTPEGFRQLGAGKKGEIKVKVEQVP